MRRLPRNSSVITARKTHSPVPQTRLTTTVAELGAFANRILGAENRAFQDVLPGNRNGACGNVAEFCGNFGKVFTRIVRHIHKLGKS